MYKKQLKPPAAFSVVEGQTATFKVGISRPISSAASGSYTIDAASTATAGSDYTDPATKTFSIVANGRESADVSIVTLNETGTQIVEADETIVITIASADTSTAAVIGDGQATITITDNDIASLSVVPNPSATVIGSTVTFTGTLSAAIAGFSSSQPSIGFTGGGVTLTFTDTGDGADGTTPDGILSGNELIATATWSATAEGTFMFPFVVNSANLTALGLTDARLATGTSGTPASTSVIVSPRPPPELDISLAGTIPEGQNGTITVTSTEIVEASLAVPIVLQASTDNNTADTTDDFAGANLTATIPAGQREATVVFGTTNDRLVEGDERFLVNFGTLPTGITAKPGFVPRAATITDDDTAALSISPNPATAAERSSVTFRGELTLDTTGTGTTGIFVGTGNTIVFDVSDTADTPAVVSTLSFTDSVATGGGGVPDGLINGAELRTNASPVWTAAGSGEVSFTAALRADGIPTGAGIALTAGEITRGKTGVEATTSVTVQPSVQFTRTPLAADITEGDTGTQEITLNLETTQALATASSIGVTLGVDASVLTPNLDPDTDLMDAAETFTLAAGTTDHTITFTLVNDVIIEGDEVFTVELTAVAGAPYVLGSRTETEITVEDNDDDNAVLRVALVADGAETTEITSPSAGQSVKIKAALQRGSSTTDLLTAADDVTITPAAFADAWGNTALPAAFTITQGESTAFSDAFSVASTEAGSARIAAPTFSPAAIGTFESPGDARQSAAILLPAPPTIPVLNLPARASVAEGDSGANPVLNVTATLRSVSYTHL
ncbi:MAG: hypothetical protein MPK62_06135, partial [Alphaproteobacteria bacterium]|nr:hypothetical protein [Alphaproteobacteria bacterium]